MKVAINRGRKEKTKASDVLRMAVLYTGFVAVSVVTIGPFVWMISTSFKLPSEAIVIPPQWIPNPFTWQNYQDLFMFLPFMSFMANSVKVAVSVVLLRLLVCSLGAYGFARFEFPGRDFAFAMLVAALMIPLVVAIIPLYLGYKYIGWLDTLWPLIIPPAVANTFGTFLIRQFFMTVPKEYDDAAYIDGASTFDVYWRILLPLSKPVLATLAIFSFMGTWNEFFEPLIFLNSLEKFTVAVGLAFFQGQYDTQYTMLMAGALIAMLPILVVYCFCQQYFESGLSLGGLKG